MNPGTFVRNIRRGKIEREIYGCRIVCLVWRIRLDRDEPIVQKFLNLKIGQDHAVLRALFSGTNCSFLTQTRLNPLTVGLGNSTKKKSPSLATGQPIGNVPLRSDRALTASSSGPFRVSTETKI